MNLTAYLAAKARSGAVVQSLLFSIVAALAVSRAEHAALAPLHVVFVVGASSMVAALTGWLVGLHEGGLARANGEVVGDVEPIDDDPLEPRSLWRGALTWAAAAGAWGASAGVLAGAALRGESAPWLVVAAALVVVSGSVAVVVETAARAVGARAAARFETARPAPVPLRRRAWLHLALPLAAVQTLVNVGFAWMLFHDYGGDPATQRPLTEADVLADSLLVVALLATIFGGFAVRWGRLDAIWGRVTIDDDTRAGVSAKAPIGPQGLVYVGALALVLARLAGLFIPPAPSLERTMLVRGLFAGVLVLVVAAFGYVRGAVNGAAGAQGVTPLDTARPVLPPSEHRGSSRALRRRRLGPTTAGASIAALAVLLAVPAARDRSAAGVDELLLGAEAESFAVRVEYDIPLPVGSGTVPRVVGEIRRVSGGENAKGLAAAPSDLGPVVGGTYANPDKEGKGDESTPPQAECFYPGALVDTSFRFPTDNRPETKPLPATGYATARCDAGPYLELRARVATADDQTAGGASEVATAGAATGHALLRPVDGVLQSTTRSNATDVSLFDGLVTVDSIRSYGASSLTGAPGEAVTDARTVLQDVRVGDVHFSIEDDRLVVGDESFAIDSAPARAVLDGAESALAALDCRIDVLSDTDAYPQGFLFSRGEPTLGVQDDGRAAGSMAGGLLLTCDPPEELTGATEFRPQRVQILLGFAFTSVTASEDTGGFGLDDLGGTGDGIPPPLPVPPGTSASPAGPAASPAPAARPTAPDAPAPTASTPGVEATPDRTLLVRVDRWLAETPAVWLVALLVWMGLTHAGIGRVRRVIGLGA